ncbi:hypothetical protein LTR64_004891 [Lithohypha guttulata]|uniref:uncharacterized protein n=1 Tax=Lithohypha guttulata TaxID=1690604 RepID=UPI002DDFB888|nr:hypothetical protein LTR51_005272 [Lithohypha guttulata]
MAVSKHEETQSNNVNKSTTNGTNGDTSKTIMETHPTSTAWHQPQRNAYDFHSDTITTPTLSMLQAITNCSLEDDIYKGDPTTAHLESSIAQLAGHEAGLLVMSGTMGNQVAIRAHLGAPPHSVLCDVRSHIVNYEAGGIATLSGAQLIPVQPKNNHHLTLEDIKKRIIISNDVHSCPTKIICLENTLNGLIMPLDEIHHISAFARENNILLHLDGARVWEAAASTSNNTSLTDYCKPFDSVSLCFSKGLGAPIGSLLVGNKAFITKAKWIRKMFGGSTRQAGIIAAAAQTAVTETFGTGPNGEGGKLRVCHEKAQRIGKIWEELGGKMTWPVETNMAWLDAESSGIRIDDLIRIGKEEGITVRSERLVIHYQIADEALAALERALRRVIAEREQQQ